MKINGKPLNFLIITTDEECSPPIYENDSAKQYQLQNSVALGKMRQHGLEFLNHHTATTACAPRRTSIYTGQYPSLHGVSQTPGIGNDIRHALEQVLVEQRLKKRLLPHTLNNEDSSSPGPLRR
ncbi:sulfatase-like hydrolase/transferase [Pseudovibrio sp. POLY-S9]|uniref:sulfatase-like hydrolase/transferase n=1 Tax=Pseudovibrio sp. POLY-S9 TaxID=1576596 RepID=UPI00070E08BA|nr:sulfatase-like hydrolase/transferase [Pseudovibrio sp. POLY-S9]